MSNATPKCARCRQPLPEGSGFCVTCGHNNESAMLDRVGNLNLALGRRQDSLGFWRRLVNMVPFLRFLIR